MKRLLKSIQRRWDQWVYARAVHSIRRQCEEFPGKAVLLKLSLERWLAENPPGEAVTRSAEAFWKLMEKAAARTGYKGGFMRKEGAS